MFRFSPPRLSAVGLFAIVISVGCGGQGLGCAGLKPLPKEPTPYGLPRAQLIEGGAQLRLTKPGLDKITAAIPGLLGTALMDSGTCAIQRAGVDIGPVTLAELCGQTDCPGNKVGCGAYIYLSSKDLPSTITPPFPKAAANVDDGKLGVTVAVSQTGTGPVRFKVRVKMDVIIPIALEVFDTGACYLVARSDHAENRALSPIDIEANIDLGISPTTGELTLTLAPGNAINIVSTSIGVTGIGGLCGGGGFIVDAAVDLAETLVNSFIGDFLINTLLRSVIQDLIDSLLPKPLGIAGTINPGDLLASFSPPPDTNLEMYLVPGGYVKSSTGGLTIGVLTGVNSDRDQATRSTATASESSLCVPLRPTPVLSDMPWMLPVSTTTGNYHLQPAGEFAGMPDPKNLAGETTDLAMGLSRSFFDLLAFHLYNSGSLCLSINGSAIPQLSASTLGVFIASLSKIAEQKNAPLNLVVRPQQPPVFTFGIGDMDDPLVKIGLADMRIDFYAWVEERYVRIFTLSIDVNLGLNLTVTMSAAGKPALQPTLVGLDAANVKITVLNTDLLGESPMDLAAVFPSLINIAASAAAGAIPPIELPAFAGFGISEIEVKRVQTAEEDFIGIFAALDISGASSRIDWSDPEHPKHAGALETTAKLRLQTVPKPADLRAAFATGKAPARGSGLRPRVELIASADGANGQPVEYAYRVDGGLWHPWSSSSTLTIEDDAFFLQGRHKVDVRSRVVGRYQTEDTTPATVALVIDSQPPDVKAAVEPDGLSAVGFDLVTAADKLEYAWRLPGAAPSSLTWSSKLTITGAELQALGERGVTIIELLARDEQGNLGAVPFDVAGETGFHGRNHEPPKSSCGGCGATGNAPWTDASVLFLLAAALIYRRKTLAQRALVLLPFVVAGAVACGDDSNSCRVDDDCAKKACDPGQIPTCQRTKGAGSCTCVYDLPVGDAGRFASMVLLDGLAYVAAYSETYGDLLIGHVQPPGRVEKWQFVDGVPREAPVDPDSRVRGGVANTGEDVGRYTSVAATPWQDPVIAYYDKTNGSLKFALFGVVQWRSHTVDDGVGSPDFGGDDVGRWVSLSVDKDGNPAIAYAAIVQSGTDGKPEGQLKWAQAKTPFPQGPDDWTITIVDRRTLGFDVGGAGTPDMGTDDAGTAAPAGDPLLPESIGIMASVARKPDGSPGIVYYDRPLGNLRYVEMVSGMWQAPSVLDGEDASGKDNGDVGMYPSLTYDTQGIGHVSYVDATRDNLMYIDTLNRVRAIVDDGFRMGEETTNDGLPSPIYHLVGDSSSIQLIGTKPLIAYQDSTTLQVRFAQLNPDGAWTHRALAGHDMPFKGAYGFYTTMRVKDSHAVVASYVINQQVTPAEFYVDVLDIDLGLVQ